MALDKTTSWAFPTRLANLATNTTLAGAARFETSAITLRIDEIATATIKSAKLRITARDAFTVATNITGWRIGVKLGAAAFDDVDFSSTQANTGDHECLIVERDVTQYFVSNFGVATTQTCQVAFAVSTAAASNVNNITCELWITYDYSTSTTYTKTIEWHLQGHHTSIGTSDVEIGTTGGTSNAAANQIPELTGASGKLPEAGVTIRQCYLRVTANEGGIAATNFNLSVKLDSGSYDARATIAQSLISGAPYRDLIDLTVAPYSIDTTLAHALVMKSSLAATFENISAVLVVTYSFTAAGTTTELHSIRAPLESERGSHSNCPPGTTVGDEERITAYVEVVEGAPTLLNAGVVIFDQMMGVNALTTAIAAPGQAFRTYGHLNTVRSGPHVYTRGCMHDDSTWALSQGVNKLSIDYRTNVAAGAGLTSEVTGYAIVNYTAPVPSTGIGSGSRSVCYSLASHQTEASGSVIVSAEERLPTFPITPWRIMGAFIDLGIRSPLGSTACVLQAERRSGEDSGNGWYTRGFGAGNSLELGRRERVQSITPWIRATSAAPLVAMDITATRRWRFGIGVGGGATSASWCGTLWITYQSCSFALSGTLTIDGAPATNGKAIAIFAYNASGEVEFVGETLTTGGTGAFTFEAPDNIRTYFAVHQSGGDNGCSAPGTVPGTFNIAIRTGEIIAPTGTTISPDANEDPGSPGAFPAAYTTAKDTPIVYDVIDAASAIVFVTISCKFSDRTHEEMVYSGRPSIDGNTGFLAPFRALSSVTGSGAAGVGHRFTLRHENGWPGQADRITLVKLRVKAVDLKGNVLL